MEFFQRHPKFLPILILCGLTLPGGIASWLFLAERSKEAGMLPLTTHLVLQWILPAIGVVLFIILLRKTRHTMQLSNEERELLALHQRQREGGWKNNVRLHLIRVLPNVVGDVPKVTFEFEMINYLPVEITLVKVTHSKGNISASNHGARSLPPLPETIGETIHACSEKQFRIEMVVSGTKLPEFLRPLLSEAGQRLQWMLKGEWYIQVYGKTEVWQYQSYEIKCDQVIAGSCIVDGAMIGPGFEFFPNRDVLSSHHPLSSRIKDAPTVWAMWHTGTFAWGQDAIKKGNLKRLILPNPRGDAPLDKIAKLIGKDEPRPLIEDIVRVTKEVLDKREKQDQEQNVPIKDRIEIRWYSGITTNSIMIGNPEPLSDDLWIQVELLIPMGANERPSFTMTYGQTPFKDLSQNLVESYKDVWSKAKPLSGDDIKWIQAFGKVDSQTE